MRSKARATQLQLLALSKYLKRACKTGFFHLPKVVTVGRKEGTLEYSWRLVKNQLANSIQIGIKY